MRLEAELPLAVRAAAAVPEADLPGQARGVGFVDHRAERILDHDLPFLLGAGRPLGGIEGGKHSSTSSAEPLTRSITSIGTSTGPSRVMRCAELQLRQRW